MLKEKLFNVGFFDIITKVSIYFLVFLIPIFFLPWSQNILDFNKQALLTFLIFISLFSWMLKILIYGSFDLKINHHAKSFIKNFGDGVNKIHIVIGILLLAYLLSTIFSVSRYVSFWGGQQVISESLLSVICFFILYFLVSNNFSQKEIFTSFVFLTASAMLVQIYGILQLLGFNIIPYEFAKSNFFNTIGSIESLGLFVSLLLPLFIIISITHNLFKSEESVIVKIWQKPLFILNVVLAFIILILINYNFVWLTSLVGSGLIIFFWIIRRDVFNARLISLPVFFFAISLFFIIFNPQLKWVLKKPPEVSLSAKANLNIDFEVLKDFPILGSGPGTFTYDFAKYRNKDFNKSSLWDINFNRGSSKILTSLATIGIFGFVASLLTMVFPIFYGVRYLIFDRFNQERKKILLILGILAVLIVQTLGYFLYNSNISLDFIYFFFIAALAALVFKNNKTYVLKSSSLLTLVVIFIFTAVFIFGFGFLILEGQRYLADMNYHKGLVEFQNGKKDEAIKYLKIAANNNAKSDLYFNQLALFSLSSLQDKVSNSQNNASKVKERKKIETLIFDSVNAANIAVNLEAKNVDNWLTKGYICQNLIGLIPDAFDCAIASYDKAIELNPANPYLYVQEGNVYMIQAAGLSEKKTQGKDNILSKARERFNKAIDLKEDYSLAYFQMGLAYYQDKNWQKAEAHFQKALHIIPNYANALYYLGLTYNKQSLNNKAINEFSKLLKLNPNNQNVQKILYNLRNNKPALDGLVQREVTNTNP